MQTSSKMKPGGTAAAAPNLLPSLAQLIESVRREFDTDREMARALLTRASSLLKVEIERLATQKSDGRSGGLASWQERRVVVFIENRLGQPVRLAELSAISRLSTAYFCRAFKRTFNATPHAYIVGRRLEKARTVMLTSDMPLRDIAAACGFTDQAHMCKLFRQEYGQSPAAWRRERTDNRSSRMGGAHRPLAMS